MRERGIRYLVMSVQSYTNQPYCDLPECFAGWMARQRPNSGELFEPRTLQQRIDLTAPTQVALPIVFDLQTQEAIWVDLAITGALRWNNALTNLSGVSIMARAFIEMRRPNLHTLFDLHIRARGSRVDRPELAQTLFALDKGITPFDQNEIAAKWL
jgi:hypothetical protein